MLWKKEDRVYYDLHCRGGSSPVLILFKLKICFVPVCCVNIIEDMQQQNKCPFINTQLYSIVCIVCMFVYQFTAACMKQHWNLTHPQALTSCHPLFKYKICTRWQYEKAVKCFQRTLRVFSWTMFLIESRSFLHSWPDSMYMCLCVYRSLSIRDWQICLHLWWWWAHVIHHLSCEHFWEANYLIWLTASYIL